MHYRNLTETLVICLEKENKATVKKTETLYFESPFLLISYQKPFQKDQELSRNI